MRSLTTKNPAIKTKDNIVKESGKGDISPPVEEQASVASLEYEEARIVSDSEAVNAIPAPEAVNTPPALKEAKRSLELASSTEEGATDPRRNQAKRQRSSSDADDSLDSSAIAEPTKKTEAVDFESCSKQVLALLEDESDGPNKLTDFIQTLMSTGDSFKIGMATSLFHVSSQQKKILKLLGNGNSVDTKIVAEDIQEEEAPQRVLQAEPVANDVPRDQPEESTQQLTFEEPWLSFGEL